MGINEWGKDRNKFTIINLLFIVNIVQMYGLLYSENFWTYRTDIKNG